MTKETKQFDKMVNTPIKKLVLSLGIPTIISMLITSVYNIADTFFVSQLGTSASGAVSVIFPLMAIIQAIGFTLGMGGGSVISSLLGEKRDEEAQVVGSSAFYSAIILGLVITVFSLLFMDPLLKLLGSTDTALEYARDYALYIVLGAPIMTGSFVLNNLLRSEGKSKLAMIGLTAGGLLNIVLDPLFIFSLDMGISGAAVATLLSQLTSFIILLSMFVFKKSIITLSIFKISRSFNVYSEVIKVGFPSMCRQGLASIATILLNNQAKLYGGDPALSAMGITSKIFMVIFSISLGIGQGYQPVCGYNYYSKRFDRVKEAMWFTLIVMLITMSVLSIFFFVFSTQVMEVFRDDQEVIKIGSKALKFQCAIMPFLSINTICNMTYQSTKQKFKATILSCCRQGIFFIPLIIVLPMIFDINGVVSTQAAADLLTFVFSVFFFINLCKDINNKIQLENTSIS